MFIKILSKIRSNNLVLYKNSNEKSVVRFTGNFIYFVSNIHLCSVTEVEKKIESKSIKVTTTMLTLTLFSIYQLVV